MTNIGNKNVCEVCGGELKQTVCENAQIKLKCECCGKEYELEYNFLQKRNLQRELSHEDSYMDSNDIVKK